MHISSLFTNNMHARHSETLKQQMNTDQPVTPLGSTPPPMDLVVIPIDPTGDFMTHIPYNGHCRVLFEGIQRGMAQLDCENGTPIPPNARFEYGDTLRCKGVSLDALEAAPCVLCVSSRVDQRIDCVEDINRVHDHMRIILKTALVMYRIRDTLYVATPGGSYVVPMILKGDCKDAIFQQFGVMEWTNMSDVECVVRVDVGGNVTLHATRLCGLISPNWPICNTPWPVQTLKPHVKVEGAKSRPKSQMELFTPMYAPPPSFAPNTGLHFNEPVDLRKMQSVLCIFPYHHNCGAPQVAARIATPDEKSKCDELCTPRFRLSEWASNRTVSCASGHYDNRAVPGTMCTKCKTEPLQATFECMMDDLTVARELLIDPQLVESILGVRAEDYTGEPKLIPTLLWKFRRSTGYLMREAPPKSKLTGYGPVQLQYVIFALY